MSSYVLSLACPQCGSILHGLNADMVFTCSSCALAFAITNNELERFPMVMRASAQDDTTTGLWLPFWEIQCNPEIIAKSQEIIDQYEIPKQVDVFVKGFSLTNVTKVGNPGLFLTINGVSPCVEMTRVQPVVVGARRTVNVAKEYAKLFILEMLDRQADIDGVSVKLNISRIRFAGIFFEDNGDTLRCPKTNRDYPAGLFDDITAIRQSREQSITPTPTA